ncbi:metallophosphoesterase [Candidatus Pacearchaeota archaeon]|nr:metallophosphoesterase [Candidatus Pacearchaeota archaeon]
MSIKILHIGDLHVGGSYPEKASASIDFLLAEMEYPESAAYKPDLIVCTGDTTDKALHVHSDHLKPLLKLIQTTQCQMVFLQGTYSHEPSGFLQNLRDATGNKIIVEDKPSLAPLAILLNGRDPIYIHSLPAMSRAMLDKWCRDLFGEPFETPEGSIQTLLRHFNRTWAKDGVPKLLLGHFTVKDCQTGTGQTLYSNDIAVSLDDLALSGADAVLLGHIHKAQDWQTDSPQGMGLPIVSYCGSSHPTNWGELDAKSFSVLEFHDHGMATFTRIPYPHKPMVKVSLAFTGEKDSHGEWVFSTDYGEEMVEPEFLHEAEVKACYTIPRELAAIIDDVYIRLSFQREFGIDLAAVERTIQSTGRERIAEIATKETTRDQYLAVCTAKGEEPRAGALEKADSLDTEDVCD